MENKIIIEAEYKRYNQPEGEPTLYQKKVQDKKGIKYFINCYHYKFPNCWEYKIQSESDYGIINTTLFNTTKTISQIEVFVECIWKHYGSIYYEKFGDEK